MAETQRREWYTKVREHTGSVGTPGVSGKGIRTRGRGTLPKCPGGVRVKRGLGVGRPFKDIPAGHWVTFEVCEDKLSCMCKNPRIYDWYDNFHLSICRISFNPGISRGCEDLKCLLPSLRVFPTRRMGSSVSIECPPPSRSSDYKWP